LDQVRHYPNPPPMVQKALEPIALLLGLSDDEVRQWKNLKAMLSKSTFKDSIVHFNIDKLSPKLAKKIKNKYISDHCFNYKNVAKASTACAPLVDWVKSMIQYAGVKNSIAPLTNEMKKLIKNSEGLAKQLDQLKQIQQNLKENIERLSKEYSQLVREANNVKREMTVVKQKVTRAISLLNNLAAEDKRWGKDVMVFEKEISTLMGDCLLTAAFLAYIGYFNQSYREMLFEKWSTRLKQFKIPFKQDLSIIDYVSHPTERLEWKEHGLPPDDLCVENAIMLRKFNRYPLIIDPSGQATDFLLLQYKERKIERTSFLDETFLKKLETSLRFGNALLVEDVESIDPTVNSVLNKEIFRQGGRVMITLGVKEVDFSPSFVIFMSTRDPSAHFTPDLCSRVTFVNFTVTHSSLSSQCLSKVLQSERPDIDKKRTDLMRLQGEFRVRLRKLEDGLLASLTSAQGNLLDNNKVIGELERLKQDAAEVHEKMRESDDVMKEIEIVSNEYKPFATVCSSIYFTLELLGHKHYLYQFSLSFFLKNVKDVLTQPSGALKKLKNPQERFKQLCKDFFNLSFSTVARGLMQKDQLAYAFRLAQIALNELGSLVFSGVRLDNTELEFLLKGTTKNHKEPGQYVKSFNLTDQQNLELSCLLSLPSFQKLDSHFSENTAEWNIWLTKMEGEQKSDKDEDEDEEKKEHMMDVTPTGWETTSIPSMKLYSQMLVVKCLRPDLFPSACRTFVSSIFKESFFDNTSTELKDFVRKDETKTIEPYLFVAMPGYDASTRVTEYADECKAKIESFAMGSPEGYGNAERAIDKASKTGGWVLLKNVHLSPSWLSDLEKSLHRKTGHSKFKLFMTMELHPKVPANLFRMSTVVIFEPPVGLKAALLRTFSNMPRSRVNKKPVERSRLFFMLAWLHSIILERLRYQPVGWTQSFEFGEIDLKCGMNALDEWIDKVSQGKSNVRVEKIPWDALQALFEKVLYGGRINNNFDQFRLEAFVQSLWKPESFDVEFPLSQTWDHQNKCLKTSLEIPDGRKYRDFKNWIDNLPAFNSPELLGLPSNADIMLSTQAGEQVLDTMLSIQDQDSGENEADISAGDDAQIRAQKKKKHRVSLSLGDGIQDAKPEWMVNLSNSVENWKKKVPIVTTLGPLPKGEQAKKLILDPLYRCMQREYRIFKDLLENVVSDLSVTANGLSGECEIDNRIRALFNVFRIEGLPKHWSIYGGPRVLNRKTSLWLPDFKKRVQLLEMLEKTPPNKYGTKEIWLGGFISPEAFVAASRQAVANYKSWSLDDIVLRVTVNDSSTGTNYYCFVGLRLFGAGWDDKLCMNDCTSFKMPPMRFTWILKEEAEKDKKLYVEVPVYLDDTRTKFLFSVKLERPEGIPLPIWSQRGVALCVWS